MVSVQNTSADSAPRTELVDRARKRWISDLMDLSGRNNLLNYRDLKAGTLALDGVDPKRVYALLGGKSIRLSKLFPRDEARSDAVRRARNVHSRAKVAKEERGIQTLHLALGLATWKAAQGGTQVNAPFLLVPLELMPAGGAQTDFSLRVNGELELNPVLIQRLRADFNLTVDADALSAASGIIDAIDTPEEYALAGAWMRERCARVEEFELTDRVVIGNFSYAKLPMVRDLEESLDALVANDLIAALSGDSDAQQCIRAAGVDSKIRTPDEIPSEDEFLVLDADASQSFAINAVVAGRNLIVRGPPGTGKSQTISNLVATLVARGKKVLFVAEKRAAIDAVVGRLEDVGLSDLVMDLHATGQSKKLTVKSIADALSGNRRIAPPDVRELHARLDAEKQRLIDHVDALHSLREPWQRSFFEANCELMALGTSGATESRLDRTALDRLTPQALLAARNELRDLVDLDGLRLPATGSPWAASKIASDAEVEQAREGLEMAIRSLASLAPKIAAAQPEAGYPLEADRRAWERDFGLWGSVEAELETWKTAAFSLPVDELLTTAEELAESVGARAWATITDGEYRSAKKQLRGGLKDGVEFSAAELHDAAKGLAAVRAEVAAVAGTPISVLPRDLTPLAEQRLAFEQTISSLETLAGISAPCEVDELDAWLKALRADSTTLARLPRISALIAAQELRGLGDLLEELSGRHHTADDAVAALDRLFLTTLIEHLTFSDTFISGFEGAAHARNKDEFIADDRTHISVAADRVRRACAENAIAAQDADPEQSAVVTAEAAKKRPRKSLRELFGETSDVLLALKPCWAMSPLIVSQVLPADEQFFDVVVFDEGSQVRPADAIPAIMRGKQLIVAGDERQLPPTDFFSAFGDSMAEDPDPDAPALVADSSYESILDAYSAFVDVRTLEWHYRSRDERLIAFSNAFVYDGSLTTFPGVIRDGAVRHVLVNQSAADPNAGESADVEVRRVVELVLEHAETNPDHSLGVIAMGIKHAERIDAALRAALAELPEMEFFDESREEPFFVKNLERVQGDERDSIILSIGYGKSADGKMLYRFGPINNQGGERRLNVAVTRAKRTMTLVSSFSHADMDPARCKSRGVELLREYIAFCASGGDRVGETISPPPQLNAFEIDIRNALEDTGIAVEPQVGCSGYRIDFAAKHPDRPGEFVLAIECDGASYHASKTARDRDRLRQEHLERLGWRFHRIWSQDWFKDRAAEVRKVELALEAALAAAERGAVAPPADTVSTSAGSGEESRRTPRPRIPRRNSIDLYSESELIELVRWIGSDGLLRTEQEVINEVVAELGFARRGARIVEAVHSAIAASNDGIAAS